VGVGERDYRGLVAELEAPVAYAGRMDANPVWHCPLRTAPGDRVLTDAEWADVAADLMDRTGIAPRGDDGGCRWIAVRHDEVSIHVVAVLARQDGGRAHVFRDYPQVRATCLAAEARYGLVVTAPADRTSAVSSGSASAATHTTRAEREKAARRATRTMRTAAGHWDSETAQFLAAQQPSAAATTARAALPAAVTTPSSTTASPRPAHGPPPGRAPRGLLRAAAPGPCTDPAGLSMVHRVRVRLGARAPPLQFGR